MGVGGLSSLWVVSPRAGSCEQATESKPVSSAPPWLLHQFPSSVFLPWLLDDALQSVG